MRGQRILAILTLRTLGIRFFSFATFDFRIGIAFVADEVCAKFARYTTQLQFASVTLSLSTLRIGFMLMAKILRTAHVY